MSILVHPNYFVAHNYQIMSLTDRTAYTIEVAPFGVVCIFIFIIINIIMLIMLMLIIL